MTIASGAVLRDASAFTGSPPAVTDAAPSTQHPGIAAGGPALALEGISLAFGGIAALTEISFSVAPGQIRAIIGPNGAGKSSLINVISGIYQPDCGRIQIG